MTRIVARILCSMVCAPMVVIACVAFVFLTDEFNLLREDTAATFAASFSPIMLAIGWLAVWFRVIRWTPRRRVGTMLLLVTAVLAALVVMVIGSIVLGRRWARGPLVFLVNMGIGLVMLGLLLRLWTETTVERLSRVRAARQPARLCPACRYDMSGLTSLVCPECGSAFTLGQLADEHQRTAAPADLE